MEPVPDPVRLPKEVIKILRPDTSWITVASGWRTDGSGLVDHVWVVWDLAHPSSEIAGDVRIDQFDESAPSSPDLNHLATIHYNNPVYHNRDRARTIWNQMRDEGYRVWDIKLGKVCR